MIKIEKDCDELTLSTDGSYNYSEVKFEFSEIDELRVDVSVETDEGYILQDYSILRKKQLSEVIGCPMKVR